MQQQTFAACDFELRVGLSQIRFPEWQVAPAIYAFLPAHISAPPVLTLAISNEHHGFHNPRRRFAREAIQVSTPAVLLTTLGFDQAIGQITKTRSPLLSDTKSCLSPSTKPISAPDLHSSQRYWTTGDGLKLTLKLSSSLRPTQTSSKPIYTGCTAVKSI